ncbi:MAG: GNAT family N-acetyltransferase [Clostridiales bacterium]|nr:GNAT family N-acetyltransferase [Clostridiales bacterium]
MKNDNRLTIRRLGLSDDLSRVALLVYKTDEFIFPYMFNGDIAVAQTIISNMITRDTIYNAKNILVAALDDKVVGIVVAQKTPIKTNRKALVDSYTAAGIKPDERFETVYAEYYTPLGEEPEGVYIANVCVDENYRRQGIARKMLESMLSPEETYYLESVKDNLGAVKLYQSLGFAIEKEIPGFMTTCYSMKKSARRK